MTPAIQKIDIRAQSESEAEEQSINLTHIFKKMKPFPEKMSRPALTVGLDLGRLSWHAMFLSARRKMPWTFSGDDKREQLLEILRKEMARLGIAETRDVVVCHEIGRDGIWLRDWLLAHGFPCVILTADVLSGSGREAKTDRIDALRLAVRLCRFFDGELECDHVYLPPPREILEWRVVSRSRASAVASRTEFGNQFSSMLDLQMEAPCHQDIRQTDVDALRDSLGRPLSPNVTFELKRLQRHYLEMDADVAEADRRMEAFCREAQRRARAAREERETGTGGGPLSAEGMLLKLKGLRGIGTKTSWVLVHEMFYKKFRNVGQVGSATGLVALPRSSGSSDRCAGISRRSNGRLRATLVELAWLWIRYQPDSALSRWFGERTREGVSTRRMRKVAIVAVARKLAVSLWKYLERGEVPEGAKVTA